jgi:hypothetical protein
MRVTAGDPCALTFLSSKYHRAFKSVGAASPIDSPAKPGHSVVRVESRRHQFQRNPQQSEVSIRPHDLGPRLHIEDTRMACRHH